MTRGPERSVASRRDQKSFHEGLIRKGRGRIAPAGALLVPLLALVILCGCSLLLPGEKVEISRSFETLIDWKLFQRGPDDTSDIPLNVRWGAKRPATLEARIVRSGSSTPLPGFDWEVLRVSLDASAGHGSEELVLPRVPAGGHYDVEVRLISADEENAVIAADRVESVAVGDVFLAAGQSNMSGYSGELAPAEAPEDMVHLFGNDYVWKRGVEPMDSSDGQLDGVSLDPPARHSLMLRFAKEIVASTGVPVGIVPAPRGASKLWSEWQRDGDDPRNRETLYGSAIHRILSQRYAHPIRGVLWYQGESDVGRGTVAYLEDLTRIVSSFRSDLGDPELFFASCQIATSTEPDIRGWVAIQEAQRRYAEVDPRSALVGLADLPRWDYTHLSVAGYKAADERLARAVLDGSYGLERNLGPRLLSVTRDADGIALEYDEPVAGGSTALYDVVRAEGGTALGVRSVAVDGTKVVVALYGDPAGELLVSYGFGLDPEDGWIVAADGSGAALAFDRIPVVP